MTRRDAANVQTALARAEQATNGDNQEQALRDAIDAGDQAQGMTKQQRQEFIDRYKQRR